MGYYKDTRVFKCSNTDGFLMGYPEPYVELYQTDLSSEGCDASHHTGDPVVYTIPKRIFDKYFIPAPAPDNY